MLSVWGDWFVSPRGLLVSPVEVGGTIGEIATQYSLQTFKHATNKKYSELFYLYINIIRVRPGMRSLKISYVILISKISVQVQKLQISSFIETSDSKVIKWNIETKPLKFKNLNFEVIQDRLMSKLRKNLQFRFLSKWSSWKFKVINQELHHHPRANFELYWNQKNTLKKPGKTLYYIAYLSLLNIKHKKYLRLKIEPKMRPVQGHFWRRTDKWLFL